MLGASAPLAEPERTREPLGAPPSEGRWSGKRIGVTFWTPPDEASTKGTRSDMVSADERKDEATCRCV